MNILIITYFNIKQLKNVILLVKFHEGLFCSIKIILFNLTCW